jgi:hypothetical protein
MFRPLYCVYCLCVNVYCTTATGISVYVVMYVPFCVSCVLFVCKCVLYYCNWVSTNLQLNLYIISYRIISRQIYPKYQADPDFSRSG